MFYRAAIIKLFIPLIICVIFVCIILKESHVESSLDKPISFSERLKRNTDNGKRMSNVDACFICKQLIIKNITQENKNVTMCQTGPYYQKETDQSSTTLEKLLQVLPKNTTYLQIIVKNTPHGYLDRRPHPLNFTCIPQLDQLVSLNVSQHSENYVQHFILIFEKKTFSKMKKLKELVLDIRLIDQSLKDIVSHMESLELLFLQTYGISMVNMSDTIVHVHPNAEKSLQKLHLSTFQLMEMDGYNGTLVMTDFLHNRIFKGVHYLYLNGNYLKKMHTGLTKHFPNVKVVDISYNLLFDTFNIPSFIEILAHGSTVNVSLQHQGYSDSDRSRSNHHLLRYKQSGETSNYIFNNHSTKYADFLFIVKCVNEHTQNITTLFTKKTITVSVMACILSVKTSQLLNANIFQPLQEIFNSSCMFNLEIPIGPNVIHIQFNDIHFEESAFKGFEMTGVLCIKRPNNLKVVNISGNQGWIPMSALSKSLKHMTAIDGLGNVEQLFLKNNYLEINASIAFKKGNFPNLQALHMGGNYLLIDQTYSFCASNKLISYLDVQDNNLGPKQSLKNFVRNCTNLKTLILSHNELSQSTLLDIDLRGTNKLAKLDLSYNKIEFFPEKFREQIDCKIASDFPDLTIDISGNPIICNCQKNSVSSIGWLSDNQKRVTLKNVQNLPCARKPLITQISSINAKLKSKCNHTKWYRAILPSLICGIFLGVGALCCYKKRYIIGYKIFKCKQSLKQCYTPENEDSSKWQYDAFISYCSDDRFWVHSSLMKTLEESYGFKLCIHYRDFPVGGSIIDTIISKMNNSRHLIVVISDVSMDSEWCQFELIQAMNQAIKLNKTIIAIQLGELKLINQNPTAGHILQTHVCLHWNDQSSKSQVFFWKKLVSALYGEQEGLCGCCWGLGSTSIKYNHIYDFGDS